MSWKGTATHYAPPLQYLHWIIVLGIIAQYVMAENAEDNEGAEHAASAFDAMNLHRSIGLLILLLAAVRILWRLIDRRPPWPATMSALERVTARVAHVALYALLFAVPLTGWALSSIEGDAIRFLGIGTVPAMSLPFAGASEEQLEELHETLFNVLAALAALHALAALKHHFWDKDGVLRSMLPGRRSASIDRV